MQKKPENRCQICREEEKIPGHAYCQKCRDVLDDIQRENGRRSKYCLTLEQKAFREQKVQDQIQRIELERLSLIRREGPTPWVVTYPSGKREFFVTYEAAKEAILVYKRNECIKQTNSHHP